MSWDAYCNLPSATCAAICGVDGTQWGKKGDWKSAKEENLKLFKVSRGAMCPVNGIKYMIVNESDGVFFGVKGDNCICVRKLTKCFLMAIGPKNSQSKLISEINGFAEPLAKGGY
mmetsp:Transcript_17193/g.30840  ORF Transcript_17193/g.30840 Transcript_17193/m.30840 type:complete len:115 (+) Transcript_17193:89-433(+)|eukprot:CAMPEP_0197540880 /NCGR_PEP_ID=MMETSP1318-20131121/66847_1 /TAXON_ID=552666 /ORGANISM="Partenskyella glossopodia, Strain RCC365" /LENGTH=114 /DNA_ID=CAMNT_0043099991 /DNA_START=534 /DNA_END=878 /DNA_ORIENTATION=-